MLTLFAKCAALRRHLSVRIGKIAGWPGLLVCLGRLTRASRTIVFGHPAFARVEKVSAKLVLAECEAS